MLQTMTNILVNPLACEADEKNSQLPQLDLDNNADISAFFFNKLKF